MQTRISDLHFQSAAEKTEPSSSMFQADRTIAALAGFRPPASRNPPNRNLLQSQVSFKNLTRGLFADKVTGEVFVIGTQTAGFREAEPTSV